MHEVLVNRLGGLSLPRKSVVRLTDRLDMTLDVYRGRETTKTTIWRKTCHALYTAFLKRDSFIRTNRATVALFVGFRRIELRQSLYSKVALIGTTRLN